MLQETRTADKTKSQKEIARRYTVAAANYLDRTVDRALLIFQGLTGQGRSGSVFSRQWLFPHIVRRPR